MPLVDSTYFIGEKNIPNTTYSDVSSLLDNLIMIHEEEYLIKAMGYELYSLFVTGLLENNPAQIWLDILFGKVFIGFDGRKKQWKGLVTLTTPNPSFFIKTVDDIFFKVGEGGNAPNDGDASYVNTQLSGKKYRVLQQGFGPLEPDVDITINDAGGFTWLNGIKFSNNNVFNIQFLNAEIILNSEGYAIAAVPESPIADYVYYWYVRNLHTQTSGMGEVRTKTEFADSASPKVKMSKAWNDMVRKTLILNEFLRVNYSVYPDFQYHSGSRELRNLITKINSYNF